MPQTAREKAEQLVSFLNTDFEELKNLGNKIKEEAQTELKNEIDVAGAELNDPLNEQRLMLSFFCIDDN